MDRLINAIKGHSGGLDLGQGQPRFGTITSFDPNSYAARVMMQPEGVLSNWLPVLAAWVGNGWGIACPPSVGDQVMVIAQEGHAEQGVIIGCAYSEQMRPPQIANAPVPSGEAVLFHTSGAYLRFANDGGFILSAAAGNQVTVTGDLIVTGNISDQSGSHGTIADLRAAYDEHVHNDVASGSAKTSAPNVLV